MKQGHAFVIVLMFGVTTLLTTACKNPFTPRLDSIEQLEEATPDAWLPLNVHTNVLKNFQYVYNFRDTDLNYDNAIALYEKLFVNDPESQYSYEYWTKDITDKNNPNDMSSGFDEEIDLTSKLFKNVALLNLNLELSFLKHYGEYEIERAELSTEHAGEDWYVYKYDTLLIMDNPSGGFPYRVNGKVIFKIRRCTDGNYRIVRWEDLTYESVLSAAKNI